MVEIKSLTFGFDKPIFENFSYRFPEKGIVALTGSSGVGKTTLLRIISGLIKTDAVKKDGSVSFLFQDNRLLPWLTAYENISLLSENSDPHELLSRVGLLEYKNFYPAQLSGGMQRRVAFSAVLAANASVILLDEPTANLDKENAEIIRELIKEAAKTALIIIASHVTEDVALADEVIKI